MKCPFCGSDTDKVIDSRSSRNGQSIRRRRQCLDCNQRFTTYEYIEDVSLVVIKNDGSREPFSRKKLLRGVTISCAKRPIPSDRIDEIVDEIKLNMGLAIIEAVKNLVNAVIAIYNDVASKLKAFTIVFPPILAGGKATVWNPFDFLELIDIQNVPTAQTGGTIEKTGIAKVHKGETIVPAGGGGINYSPTFNISPDVDGNALKRMLEEHDRNLLSRLSRGSTLRGRFLNV